MAESTVTPTSSKVWDDGKKIHVIGTIALGASPGTYSAGGVACDFVTLLVDGAGLGIPLPGIGAQPFYINVKGIGAYTYQYIASTKKLAIKQVTFTVKTGTIGVNMTMGLDTNAATATVVGGTGITADRTLTTNQPAILSEIPAAAMPAGVSSDVIDFYLIFDKMQ